MSVTKKTDNQNLIEVFENGTILGAVLPESNISDSINSSSVITLTSDMLKLNQNRSDSNLAQNSSTRSLSEVCGAIVIETAAVPNQNLNHSSSIGEMLSQAECLNSSDSCSYDSSVRSNLKRSCRKKLKKCHPSAEIFVNHFPPSYATIYVDAGINNQQAAATTAMIQTGLSPIRSMDGGHLTVSVPVIRRSISDSAPRKGCCAGWFARPSLPFVIGILALGGVACTLGGIVLGSTGLIEHSTQYLSAALLMIGIGVSMLVISGAIWKLSIPDDSESFRCFRPSFDACRNCNSPFCSNRFLTGSYFYPEFQHRQPPPSYMTTVQECRVRLLVPNPLNESVENQRNNSPPPSYRSFSANSLSAAVANHIQASISEVNEIQGSSSSQSLSKQEDIS